MMPSRQSARACERLECCPAVFRGATSRRADAPRYIATQLIYLLTTIRRPACRLPHIDLSEPLRDSLRSWSIQHKTEVPMGEGLRRPAVHFGFGHGGQLLVGRLFLVEVLFKQGRTIRSVQLFRPG